MAGRTNRRARVLIVVLLAVLATILSSCSKGSEYLGSGDWQPQSEHELPGINPHSPPPPSTPPPDPDDPQGDPYVRATGLDQPWAIAALPDGSALVGERVSGKVTRVFVDPKIPPQYVFTIPNLDASGDGGLLGMAPSPGFIENGLVYAFITTATDSRIISINMAGVVKDDLLTGLPKAATRNGGAITFAEDGNLLIATGDTGNSALPKNKQNLAGKVLKINQFGEPATDSGSLVHAAGVGNPTGICVNGPEVYLVDAGTPAEGGPVDNAVYLVGGESFTTQTPLISYSGETAGAAGCAVIGAQINVTGLDSQSLMLSVLDSNGLPVSEPQLTMTGQYGRLRAITPDPNGLGLWVATYNRDGIGTPVPEDDRVLFIPMPAGGSGGVS